MGSPLSLNALREDLEVSHRAVTHAVLYFRDRLAIPYTYQVTLDGQRDFVEQGVRVLPAHRFFGALV